MNTVLIVILLAGVAFIAYVLIFPDKYTGDPLEYVLDELDEKERELREYTTNVGLNSEVPQHVSEIQRLEKEIAVLKMLREVRELRKRRALTCNPTVDIAQGSPSEQSIVVVYNDLGTLLTNWCFEVSSDKIVKNVSGNGKFVPEFLIPRLHFSLLVANSILVIIAVNEVLKEHSSGATDAFGRAFLQAVKEKYTTRVIISDFICSNNEIAELFHIMKPPVGVDIESTTIKLSDLLEIVQAMRMNPAIAMYGRGSAAIGFGKMGPFAHLFVRQLLGDDAVSDSEQTPDQVLVQWFASVFQTTLNAALALLARGLPKTVGSRS